MSSSIKIRLKCLYHSYNKQGCLKLHISHSPPGPIGGVDNIKLVGKKINWGKGKREEGRGKREEGRGKREEGRGKREEGRGKREEEGGGKTS